MEHLDAYFAIHAAPQRIGPSYLKLHHVYGDRRWELVETDQTDSAGRPCWRQAGIVEPGRHSDTSELAWASLKLAEVLAGIDRDPPSTMVGYTELRARADRTDGKRFHDDLPCGVCGRPIGYWFGAPHHVDDDEPDGVDHRQDASHAAVYVSQRSPTGEPLDADAAS